MNAAIFLLPLVNFGFFLRFVARLGDVGRVKVGRCRWIFGLKALSEDEIEEELSVM